jgi:hypothetical protein
VRNSAPEVEEDVVPTEEEPDTPQKKRGPMPKVAWHKARDLARELLTAVDQLAKEFGRSRRDILIAAGLGVAASHRKRNDANTYRSWYWNTQEIPPGSEASLLSKLLYTDPILEPRSETNKLIDASYKELFKGIAEKDVETREQLMAPYNQWLDEREAGGGDKDVKSVATRIQRCKDQMASMVWV